MISTFEQVQEQLSQHHYRWLVTGAAGFIGSHLVEKLLGLNQTVIGLDNLSTGRRENLVDVQRCVGESFSRFSFVEADVCDIRQKAADIGPVDFVLHQAALGSVPRSLKDPRATHRANVDGFVELLLFAREAKARRVVYASSSSVYGDNPELPKHEERIGKPLSPYALSKLTNELYAQNYAAAFGIQTVGLRYFNVFGPRQDPSGAYAAVIPLWIKSQLSGMPCQIHGDGATSRDFCFISNVVQANILAAMTEGLAPASVFNVALGCRTSLLELHGMIAAAVAELRPTLPLAAPNHGPRRQGDIDHSQAAIDRVCRELGFSPEVRVAEGIRRTVEWYAKHEAD